MKVEFSTIRIPEISPDRRNPALAAVLERLYASCGNRARLDKDPLALVVPFQEIRDREVAGLVCSMLAFGSVELILGACKKALKPLGSQPAERLLSMSDAELQTAYGDFQYRFCFPQDMVNFMLAIRNALRRHGSLNALFLSGRDAGTQEKLQGQTGFLLAASAFVRVLKEMAGPFRKNLLPDPADGSACKRLFLYFRWMVRQDAVDPGGWEGVSPAELLVPLDTHMLSFCRGPLGFLEPLNTARQSDVSPSLRDAVLVTAYFRLYAPDDPVKYDFALTRLGIDPRDGDLPLSQLLQDSPAVCPD